LGYYLLVSEAIRTLTIINSENRTWDQNSLNDKIVVASLI